MRSASRGWKGWNANDADNANSTDFPVDTPGNPYRNSLIVKFCVAALKT